MKFYKNYLEEYQKGLLGYSTIAIIGQSCLGSIAAMYLLKSGTSLFEMIQLFLITILCMGYNGAILSQQKAKISFHILILSIFASIAVIVINLI